MFSIQLRRQFSTSRVVQNVGFIGLGNMGRGMAKNLLDKGHAVVAFDTDSVTLKETVALGAKEAASPKEVASQCKQIITMLPNNEIVKTVYTCPTSGVLQALQKDTFLIDSSTVDPAVSKHVAASALEAGASAFVDAPVSGGVNAAAAGTLTFMVGAPSEKDFDTAKSLLEDMGKNIIYCGEVGTGGAVKICNNMLLAISMIGVSETMNLGINLGLDPKLLSEILSNATGRCWSVDTYNPVPGVMPNVPSSNEYKGGFGASLMLKDLGLSQDAATRTDTSTPLGALSLHMFRMMCNSGYAQKDFSSAFEFLKKDK